MFEKFLDYLKEENLIVDSTEVTVENMLLMIADLTKMIIYLQANMQSLKEGNALILE